MKKPVNKSTVAPPRSSKNQWCQPYRYPSVPLLLIFTIFAALTCFDIHAQSDTYKRALVNSTIVFDTDLSLRSGYLGDHGHIGSIAVSEGGSFFVTAGEKGVNVYETHTGTLIGSFDPPKNKTQEGVFAVRTVLISSNRYIFALFTGGIGLTIDLLTGKQSVFETPHSGKNDWDFWWKAFVTPGDSVLVINRFLKGSWQVSLRNMSSSHSDWYYNVIDLQKDLFISAPTKNSEPDWDAPLELRRYPFGEIVKTFDASFDLSTISPDATRLAIIHRDKFRILDIESGDILMERSGYNYIQGKQLWLGNNMFMINKIIDPVTLAGIEIIDLDRRAILGTIAASETVGHSYTGTKDYFINFASVTRAPVTSLRRTLNVFDINKLRQEEDFFLDIIYFEREKWEDKLRTDFQRSKVYTHGPALTDTDSTGPWNGFNFGSSNNSGFTAIPAGGRSTNGGFTQMHSAAFFWGQTSS